jgi:hypothetical protein
MNTITNQQRNTAVQIPGIIQNYRKVTTRMAKPMATFTVGTFPAKCFDVTVDTAEHWAATGKRVLVAGHLSNHDGTIELVAKSINLAPAGQTDAQTDFTQGGYAEISAQEQAPVRESSTITENLSGSVTNIKTITTLSGRPMITFKIGNISCKAFGELAGAIHKSEGKQIEISARKGRFRGVTEYAVEIVNAINGVPVDLRDGRTTSPGQHISKTVQTPEATNQQAEIEAYELFLQREIESDRWVREVKTPPINNQPDQPVLISDGTPSQSTPTADNTQPKEEPSGAEFIETATQSTPSVKSIPEPESLVNQWVRRFRHSSFPDHELEYKLTIGDSFVAEAARRVLEERAKQRAEDNLTVAACF